ncbi:MAG: acetyl-CoA carboxylase biotin carboxyl carrier protein subunit [Candidatus Kapabacteria bacterium]|jgi:acetyl-CoA/propionyl-CoA carboxylase biotin carboxyl carrier protein|nr:acetyl-CoA carboxylase biotin carboxyl carrier protein subunit [Candidatus Kapabacteria bacterium]
MEIKYNNDVFEIEVAELTDKIKAKINSDEISFNGRVIDENMISITLDGRAVDCFAAADDNNVFVNIGGQSYTFDKISDEDKDYADVSVSEDLQELRAPMPGSVVAVPVEVGQTVKEGDVLLIVEAMKMETSLYSAIDGSITEINCKSGEQIDTDTILIKVEKDEE